jgi:hypothetical protein
VSRKTVPISVSARAIEPAAGRRVAAGVIDARSDEWVSDRNSRTQNDDAKDAPAHLPGFVLDLAAERSLTETVALCWLAPCALAWFWLVHAMSGRARF